jgi:hypothetical protein
MSIGETIEGTKAGDTTNNIDTREKIEGVKLGS